MIFVALMLLHLIEFTGGTGVVQKAEVAVVAGADTGTIS
jgi:ribosomal protein S28E/S33